MGKKIRSIKINKRLICASTSSYVVAEISGNHNGKISNLKSLILKAKKSGCDAVKIQAYQANTITIDSKKKDFLIDKKNTWKKYKNLFSLYKKAETPFKWYAEIFKYCKKIKITVFASVFDISSVNILEKLNCPAYKIASPEITDIPLISYVAKTKKPVILSNGLSNFSDLSLAIKTIRNENNNNIIVLKCTSAYPAPLEEINLKTMIEIKKKFNCLSGFSDHTLGINTAVHAASMGASMIEKHICLKKNSKVVDSFFSSTPQDFKKMISIIRNNSTTSGKIDFKVSKSSKKNMNGRRSLYIVSNIKKNEKLTINNIRSIRPQYGLHPKYLKKILNKKVNKDIEAGQPFKLSYLK
tara:strand:- start:666 stop:1730 length:1065 start_codon:yes stop_codon:yes gene_type:complete